MGVALAAVAAAAVVLSVAGPAAAVASGQPVWNGHTNRCLEDSNSAGLRTYTCNGSDYQKWQISSPNGADVILRNAVTGNCLDDSYSGGLRMYACNNLEYQNWDASYGYRLRNEHTNYCLDDSWSSGLRAITCNGLNYQDWHY